MMPTIFHSYLSWVGRRAKELHADRVYFLSREGIWLAQQYEVLRSRSERPNSYPRARHLAVSRLSTYLPSFQAVDEAVTFFRQGQYREASKHALLTSLGYDGCGDPVFNLESRRQEQRVLLLRYLGEQGVTSNKRAVVADIGWRGSIQDNLARVAADVEWLGLYFHLQPFITPQAPNSCKESFLISPSDNRYLSMSRRLRFAAPLEFLLSDCSGAVVGYELQEGKVQPKIGYDPNILGEDVWGKLLILRRDMETRAKEMSLESDASRDMVLKEVLRVLENPNAAIYEPFFRARRDESFGAGQVVQAEKIAPAELLTALINPRQRRKVADKLAISGWPWAMLKRDVPYIAPVLQRILQFLDPTTKN